MGRLGSGIGLCVVLLLASAGSAAQIGPQPPCAGAPAPAYAAPGSLPAVRIWTGADLGSDWLPPACTGWQSLGFRTLVAVAGRFPFAGGAEDLLSRFAAVSALPTIRYWSVSDQQWENLVRHASALRGPDAALSRSDFRVDELIGGADWYVAQSDNRSGDTVVYRWRVRELGPDRLTVQAENVSPVRYLFLPLAGPGDLQVIYFLERQTAQVWSYYSLARTSAGTSSLLGGHEASYANRALAMFRYLAGLPTDQEPPAVP